MCASRSGASQTTSACAVALRWWTERQLDAIAIRATQAWTAWSAGWLGESSSRVEVQLAHEVDAAADWNWSPIGTRANAVAWIASTSRANECVGRELFEGYETAVRAATPPSVAQSVVVRAMDDLLEQLRTQLELDAPPDQLLLAEPCFFAPWSGCVVLRLPVAQARVPVLLNVECVEALLGMRRGEMLRDPAATAARAPLTPLASAIANRRVTLRAELEPCELDLGTLEQLAIGDVVPLAHSLDAPLRISVHGEFLCEGFLGRREGRKAIELLQHETANLLEQSPP
ncbi:MAG: FliM/FliN family flagellar motor switch protein [Ramlibacter sp.]|nr:FliM/FliN family flagellar motor switch protein [Ramlibacter sp.]